MGNDATVDIKLKTTADTRSIKELEDELRKAQITLKSLAATDPHFAQQAQAVGALKGRLAELNSAQGQIAGSSRNMGNAVLQASRGIQDMQYGLAGAVNNLEGIASALGLGAGVAGAVTLVAVAVQTLGPHVVEWFKSLDTEGKKLDELKTKLREGAELILGEWTPASQAAKDEADKFTDSIKSQADAFGMLDKAQQASLDILKKRQSVDAEIAKTKEENDIADIKAKLPKEEQAGAIAAVKLEKAKADRKRELETMQGEQAIAGEAVNNATQEAEMAAKRKADLEREKRVSIRSATIDLDLSGHDAVKDDKGNVITPAKKSAYDRVNEAKSAALVEFAGGEGEGTASYIAAQQRVKQEEQRLADLQSEQKRNVAMNGGNTHFRKVEDIDKDLAQADSAAEAAAKKKQDAEFEKSKLEKLQFEQKRKVENDYAQAQNKAVAGLPTDERKPKTDHEHVTDPFEEAARKRQQTPRRDLVAEERGAAPRPPNERRNLVAEEIHGGGKRDGGRDLLAEEAKALAESNKAANEAVLAALRQATADNKKLTEQLKNSRS